MPVEVSRVPPSSTGRRRFLRRIGAAAGSALCLLTLYALLLAHPEPLFAASVTHGNLTFYSSHPLGPGTASIAAEVAERLTAAELGPPVAQRVFVVERPWLWTLLNGPYRGAIARNVELGNAILLPTLDVEHRTIRHFDGRVAGAVGVLTHESVHTLVQRRIGLLRLWRLPGWKKEGYPEYIASQRCARSEAPATYRDAARIWKTLLETNHLTFDQIIALEPE
jgi:hypothetical protein